MGDFDHLEGHDPKAEEAVTASPPKDDKPADKPATSSKKADDKPAT